MKIANITAREILDSRGNPTVEAQVTTLSGVSARASVPGGASTGSYEAVELRDKESSRYRGKGVLKAVSNIKSIIAPEIVGRSVFCQSEIDSILIETDGTKNKSNLGANATLAVSLATAKAAAKSLAMPLYRYLGGVDTLLMPIPMMNIINGGRHSSSPVSFQEFMIRPVGGCCFKEALRMGVEVFYSLSSELKRRGLSTAVGDEGGFAPAMDSTEDVLETIISAIEGAGFRAGREITLALDCAASEFFKGGEYDYTVFEGNNGSKLTTDRQVEYIKRLVDSYPIDSVEDPLSEDDWEGWHLLTTTIGNRCQIVGDDLFVTNTDRIRQGIKKGCANAVLIKPNQIGTLSETIDAVKMAQKAGFATIISHRSGETEDTTIADIAVALGAGQIKCGSLSRSERTAKYNRLLRIEEQLGGLAKFNP